MTADADSVSPPIVALALILAATVPVIPDAARAQSGLPKPERIAAHHERARQLAGDDVTAPFEFFCVAGNARPNDPDAPALEPVRLFDDLFVLGNSETVVYALTTSEGIVLIDSGFADEVESIVVPGLVELGLDPADVELVLLGHGHADHYGGAAYFQSRYGARVGTTAADWETIDQPAASPAAGDAPKPTRDLIVRDAEPIVVGDRSILPIAVPGHTPGALAFVFAVHDAGEPHVAGLFGGTVLASDWVSLPGLEQYVESLERFIEIAAERGVDVEIQNHPIFDDTPARLAALQSRRPGDAHPFVIGTDGYRRFWKIVSECMQAEIVRRGSEG